ncbi:hypothetical protein, partial [Trinickia sp.]|uniref:hypothetical protein n=1 Tax=Trinickia sp. TaxID=2571163 RepID=UPI003F804B03
PVVLQFDRGVRTPRSAPQKWTAARRFMVCTALASGAFALVTYTWRVLDAGSRATDAAAVEVLELRLRESRTKVASLPQLRDTVRAQPAPGRMATRPASGDWHAVADLASRAGVTLHALSPASAATGARGRNEKAARNTLRIDGRGDFAGLHAFLDGLSTLPMLVVPEALEVKPENGALALSATLDVFDLSPARAASVAEARAFTAGVAAADAAVAQAAGRMADPFEDGAAGADAGASVGRLVGVVRDGRSALALFEPASGLRIVTAVQGQALGQERVVAIDAAGVTLASAGATRRVMFAEGER